MSRNRIPERVPLGDLVAGFWVRIDSKDIFIFPNDSVTLDSNYDFEIIASGEFVVRYALIYLGKPHLAIVPGLVALDYGDMLVGEEGWSFILKKSNLHPRADVLGYRNDGVDDMISIKWLDLVLPVHVLLYRDAIDTLPLTTLTALISSRADLPPRLLDYLPLYTTIDDWRSQRE
ncbi:MAG: hypothetical protein H7Y09_02915 [Chitinophagaceae bacterium]|nr:hypothetical protein [Anaerolineae bacterium]